MSCWIETRRVSTMSRKSRRALTKVPHRGSNAVVQAFLQRASIVGCSESAATSVRGWVGSPASKDADTRPTFGTFPRLFKSLAALFSASCRVISKCDADREAAVASTTAEEGRDSASCFCSFPGFASSGFTCRGRFLTAGFSGNVAGAEVGLGPSIASNVPYAAPSGSRSSALLPPLSFKKFATSSSGSCRCSLEEAPLADARSAAILFACLASRFSPLRTTRARR